jgi:transcriptional regulator with XRE-family HTH domain
MDDVRAGRALRTLRHRLAWRQVDVGAEAGLSQDDVSRHERGRIRSLSKLRRHAAALDADLALFVRWRGGDLDRLLDEGHAAVAGWIVELLASVGWEAHAEVSFAVRGERGSIDVLAWHPATRTLLAIEVKTSLTSVEETLRRHDAKQRLAPGLAEQRFGWQPAAVCRLLVLPGLSTPRRQVARHEALMSRAYRLRGAAARSWLAGPSGAPSLLLFASPTHLVRDGQCSVSRRRVRRRSTRCR